jgi:hypothetical protein
LKGENKILRQKVCIYGGIFSVFLSGVCFFLGCWGLYIKRGYLFDNGPWFCTLFITLLLLGAVLLASRKSKIYKDF